MLQLQRASAGSGKTYTLAKKYIWFLIAIKEPGREWRLRNRHEIADGLSGILAITFTNKATNEMKQRIISKLADLAKADSPEPVSEKMLAQTAYLRDFSRELNADPRDVGKACGEALAILLNMYSDFHVSTIDSFFQSVLRTFAYESNLSDSYQVEIDSDYVATAAVDATLDEINNSPLSSPSSFWIELLTEEASAEGGHWNVFQKSDAPNSIYSSFRNFIKKLESEEFKGIRKALDEYFESSEGSDRLAIAYTTLKKDVEKEVMEPLKRAKHLCRNLRKLLAENNIDPKTECMGRFESHLRKIPLLVFNESPSSKNMFKPLSIAPGKSLLKKGVVCGNAETLTSTAVEMYEAFSQWLEARQSARWRHWTVYSSLLPYLGLLFEARKKMQTFLETNNLIQLGETNSMLKRIIGDDDTPFIYERLGNSIDHYLIDEFQDTSRMQWENLRPLLLENDSRGKDNLIIGDAKQSIYRFRNADPSLISSVVPEEFPTHLAAGTSKADNTNWRSDRRIVEFNNFFFHALSAEVAAISEEKGGMINFSDLYSNVAQYPSHRDEEGYVELRFLSPVKNDEGEETDVKSLALAGIGPLISSLLSRGYRQRDIALLVATNSLGKEIINALVDYNSRIASGSSLRKIDFISEDSLLVSSSEAVGIIISVLGKMAAGSHDSGNGEKSPNDWTDIRCNFNFFACRHPEMSAAMQVEAFLNEESPSQAIGDMLAGMQAVALPALVEAITENFVPVEMRRSQAVFIAALQDMVLSYCDRYASDIASFLEWWKSKGVDKSISSPEGTDAVQIMTIHKSKGLEFKCVILPFATSSIVPARKSEWRWVKPASCFADYDLPPFIPVETRPDLLETEHADVFRSYHDLFMMDSLNSLYVAFTRAASELYVITKLPRHPSERTVGAFLNEICGNADGVLDSVTDPEKRSYMLPSGMAVWNETRDVLTFGSKPEKVESHEEEDPDDNETDKTLRDELVIEEYGVDSSPAILHYVESEANVAEDAVESDETLTHRPEAADSDPRSEGNLLHAIMERVKVASDLPSAILALRMRGLITSRQAREWEPMLSRALTLEGAKRWFTPGWRVLNEREIILPGFSNRRPDRIMISKDGTHAVIVDYKFGAPPADVDTDRTVKAYRRQVGAYMSALREATSIRRISAFIWYVRDAIIIPVS